MLNKAMIFAAGFGTRLKPFTEHHPKALARVNGKSLLQRNIEYLSSFGIREFVVNIHHFPEQIRKEVEQNNGWGCKVELIFEPEILETGGGLVNAAPLLQSEENFLVMNVDILTDVDIRKMADFHFAQKPLATLCISHRSSARCLLFDENGMLSGWKNKKTGEEKIRRPAEMLKEFSFNGIHIINSEIFNQSAPAGKFSMIDWYLDLADGNNILGFQSEGIFIDAGKPESILLAETKFL